MRRSRDSVQPLEGVHRRVRGRLDVKGELALAILPTVTVLAVLHLVEAFSRQRLLFASLASSAFLIYLDPIHATNTVRTLILAHLSAASAGLGTFLLLGHGTPAGAAAMVVTIIAMVVLDAVHPPAVSTSLIFAMREGAESEFLLFGLALFITAVLVVVQRGAVWLLARLGD